MKNPCTRCKEENGVDSSCYCYKYMRYKKYMNKKLGTNNKSYKDFIEK